MTAPLILSPQDTRRLAIIAQHLEAPRPNPSKADLLATIGRITCLQLDPINVVAGTQLLVPFSRLDVYKRQGVRRSRTDQQEIPLTSVLERPLATALALLDPRRRDRAAHLALLKLADDAEAFDRLYYHLVEILSEAEIHRIVGPVGLSPHLGRGLLVDSWDAWPPQHTPTNPPYLPEMLARRGRVAQVGRLYEVCLLYTSRCV